MILGDTWYLFKQQNTNKLGCKASAFSPFCAFPRVAQFRRHFLLVCHEDGQSKWRQKCKELDRKFI